MIHITQTTMRMAVVIVATLSVIGCLLYTGHCQAGFEDVAVGARPLALGGAFVAIADDANAVYWNPAGLTRIEGIQLMGTRAWLYGVPDFHVDYVALKALDLGFLHLGFGWLNAALKDIQNENTFVLSLAHKGPGQLSLGINLKYLRLDAPGYERYNDPAYDGAQSTWGIDLGALMQFRRNFTLGLSVRNLNEPELQMLSTTTDPDVITRRLHLGAAYLFRETVILTTDLVSPTGKFGDFNLHAGGEIWFFNAYAVRVGTSQDRQSVGAGVKAERWMVDFALNNHQRMDNSYRLTVGLMY